MTNPHSIGWRANLAFKYSSRRTRVEALRNAALVMGIVIAYGIVGTIDYATEQRAEAEHQAQVAHRATYALAACMNGTARFMNESGDTAVICDKAWEVRQ